MKDSEKIALFYLSSLGMSPIYEPDGNIPPDFLVDGKIAIEVRRLNHNEVSGAGRPRGLESDRIALVRSMKEMLPSLGPPKIGNSWFVHYRFSRPVYPVAKLKRAVQEVLVAFRDGQIDGTRFAITDRFELTLIPSSKVFPDYFVLGGYVDRDTTGWLVPDLEKNIRICVREKSEK